MRGDARLAPRATTMTRHGCSNDAALAAAIGSSDWPSSVTITSVSTRLRAIEPPCSRRSSIARLILDEVVLGRSMITGGSPDRRCGARCRSCGHAVRPNVAPAVSRAPPPPAVLGHHGVGARRPPGARRVLLQLGAGPRPVLLDRVEDLPGQLDLTILREQRRLAQQHIQDQPLVGLR